MQDLSQAREFCADGSSACFERLALLLFGMGSAGRACLRARSTLPRMPAMVRLCGPAGPPPRVCPFKGFLCQGGFDWGLPVLVTAPGHVLRSYADLGWGCAAGRHRVPQCHSGTFLPTAFCCISERVSLDSSLALTRQVWRGHVWTLHVPGYVKVKTCARNGRLLLEESTP